MNPATAPLLEVRNLTAKFNTAAGALTAISDLSFTVNPGEILGIVGESGSGKSVTLRALTRLLPPMAEITGQVLWRGVDILAMQDEALRAVRGAQISMIFQEPTTALNPVLPISIQIDENLKEHTSLDGRQRRARAYELLDMVGIPDAKRRLSDFPHQFSGGMRQRAMIAIALASSPKLLLADEPTTALDVTIQDQILKLILDLREELAMSVILVTHDLGVVAATCDRMAVMYAGKIVETASVEQVFSQPNHAYTRGLLGSVPHVGAERTMLLSIEGTPPGLGMHPSGCAFNPRCEFATDPCRAKPPELVQIAPQHQAACYTHDQVVAAGSPVA